MGGAHGFEEVLPYVPDGAGEFAEVVEDLVEGLDEVVDVVLVADEWGEDFDAVEFIGGDLGEDAMFLEEWGDDELWEEAGVEGVDGFPAHFEGEGFGFGEFDGCHEAFDADLGDDFVFLGEFVEFVV